VAHECKVAGGLAKEWCRHLHEKFKGGGEERGTGKRMFVPEGGGIGGTGGGALPCQPT